MTFWKARVSLLYEIRLENCLQKTRYIERPRAHRYPHIVTKADTEDEKRQANAGALAVQQQSPTGTVFPWPLLMVMCIFPRHERRSSSTGTQA